MEEELDEKSTTSPLIEHVHFPNELRRTDALLEDIAFFAADDLEASPAAVAYGKRLREIAAASPELLVAHSYVRYLGDLSGGQVLKRAVVKAMQLPADGRGSKFFSFDLIPRPKMNQFKKLYRERLDTLPVDEALSAALVSEAELAFQLNGNMFLELDNMTSLADGDDLSDQIERPLDNPTCACPFAAMAKEAGMKMPAGHPCISGGSLDKQSIAVPDRLCGSLCPLARLGQRAPTVMAILVPLALGVAGQMSSSVLTW
jgi:heme oxygenase